VVGAGFCSGLAFAEGVPHPRVKPEGRLPA
jgi:hypothetical protein